MPRATIDIMDKLDRQTQEQVLECARRNNINLDSDLTEKNHSLYEILDHVGKLGLVLQYLLNTGFTPAMLANEFGRQQTDMKEDLRAFGVEKCFKARRSSEAFSTLGRMLDDMNVEYEMDRRITYDYKGMRYSAFPSFYIPIYKIIIFVKNSGHIEKTGRQDTGLKEKRYKVLRFSPEEIMKETTRVSFDIETSIQSCKLAQEESRGGPVPYVIAVPNVQNK